MRKVVLLTPELAEDLRRAAFEERLSESEIVRQALDAHFHPDELDEVPK